jgi:hypothetical protein
MKVVALTSVCWLPKAYQKLHGIGNAANAGLRSLSAPQDQVIVKASGQPIYY